MKKFLLSLSILFVSLCLSTLCTAQEAKFGIKGGATFNNLYIDDVNDNNIKIGGTVGFYGRIPLVDGFSIQPELLYANKGAKVSYDVPFFGTSENRFNLHYVEAPLVAVFNITPNFNIQAGGYFSYLVDADIRNTDGEEIADLDANDFRRHDAGLTGGLGFDFNGGQIGVRYDHGLTKLGNNSNTYFGNARNSSLNVTLGLNLH